MILSAKDGLRGTFLRHDTKQPVRWVRWYDDETLEWEAFRFDPRMARARGLPLRSLLYRGRCRLEFRPAAPISAKPAGRVAPATPLDEIRHEVTKGGEIQVTRLLPLPGEEPVYCQERFCHRLAEWSVAVEQLVEPERGPDGKRWERAVTVAVSVWCSWHFRAPVQISQRGVEIELENIQARPG